jgi:aryl-alcohol dehydrogenase-like predicted oxidoreductase
MSKQISSGGAAGVLGAPPLVLGGMFGIEPEDTSYERLDAFADADGAFVETAYSYVGGAAKAVIGRWLAANPGTLNTVVKIGHDNRGNDMELTEAAILHDLHECLDVLHVDALGVALLHCDDETRPVKDIAETLVGLIEAGLAQAVGVSNWQASRLAAIAHLLIEDGHVPLVSYHHSLAQVNPALLRGSSMEADSAVLNVIERLGLPLLCWSANAGGYFARRGDPAGAEPDQFDSAVSRARRDRCVELAEDLGVPPATLALAWTLSRKDTWASVGPDSPEQMAQAFAAAGLTLSAAHRAWLAGTPEPPTSSH